MLQRSRIALAQVKGDNTFKNLLNEIRQIIDSLQWAKEITKKVYINKMDSIKLQNRMDTIFLNSGNSKTPDPHRLLLNLSYKINLKEGINILLYQILAFTIHGKIWKSHIDIINLKYQLRHEMKSLSYMMGHILYQIFKITFNLS